VRSVQTFDELVQLLEDTRADLVKAEERGNKAAGTRVRKAMQQVKKLAQQVRQDVLALREGDETAAETPDSAAP